ncbi:hypothetical protein GW750_03370 [bacterium]|nr:hypothetical protein [bacterium]
MVLTEHTKPPQSGYKTVLGWFDPIKHTMEAEVETIKERISKGAKPSNRVAKILHKQTQDSLFEKFFVQRTLTRTTKNPDKFND